MTANVFMKILAPALLVSAFGSVGCNFNVQVQVKEELAGKTIPVHVIGINASEMERWKGYSATQYFRPDDPLRESAVRGGYAYVMDFGPGHTNPQTLKKTDPMWSKWHARNADRLIVLACLPGYGEKDDKPGDADPRRLVLPLDAGQWDWSYWGMSEIRVEVSLGKVTCLTPHKPVK